MGEGSVELGQGLLLHPQLYQGTDVGHDGLHQLTEPGRYLRFITGGQLQKNINCFMSASL